MQGTIGRGHFEGGSIIFRNCSGRFLIGAWLLAFSSTSTVLAGDKTHTAAPVEASAQFGSLRLLPAEARLQWAKASQRFLALAVGEDGIERDVTSLATFRFSDPSIARVDLEGRVIGLKDGMVTLIAEARGQKVIAKAALQVHKSQTTRPFSFRREIGGILTTRGCNNSVCHGGVKGKGGLKLSLDALYPRDDYKWITEGGIYQVLSAEPSGPLRPRVELKEPEKSLLLLKPTGAVTHGGGMRFPEGSPDYQTILNWVQAGAPFGEAETDPVGSIEVLPGDVALDKTGEHRLVVMAHHASGWQEDITDRVTYEALNPDVVKVSEEGVLRVAGDGETSIRVRAVGHSTAIRAAVITKALTKFPDVPRVNFIDDHVFAKLKKFNILPSEVSTDEEFLRRICLDLTGTLPPPDRAREFFSSKDPQKRTKLIEILLSSPEYDDFWTFRFADLFRVGSQTFDFDSDLYWEWIRKSVATNKPYDQMARERIAAQGYDGPSRHYVAGSKVRPMEGIMAEQVRLFLGRRMDCAQCHNHPYDTWSQDQFWGLAAFFGRTTTTDWTEGQLIYDDPNGNEVDYGVDGISTLRFTKVIHPRTKEPVVPTFTDGQVLPPPQRHLPRASFAKWIAAHPWFAEAAVNRFWGCFFGRGFVQPVDDFSSTNPAIHPDLLAALAEDFRTHGHDLKHLFRRIVQSRTYQLSSVPNGSNRGDRINYSHAIPRPLEAEVLLDAVSMITGVPEVFGRKMGNGAFTKPVPPGSRSIQIKTPLSVDSRFLEIYGRPLRDSLPERDGKSNLAQALHMWVGSTYTQKLANPNSRLVSLLESGASNSEIIEELFLASLTRLPTKSELRQLETMVAERTSQRETFESLLWALISSREFAYNH